MLKLMKNGRQTTNNIVDSLQYPSKDPKVLVEIQTLRAKSSRKPFIKTEKNVALSLFYRSPSVF